MADEKMFFFEHLSLMLKGGVSLSEALTSLEKNSRAKSLKKAIREINNQVVGGKSINQAMAKVKVFDGFSQSVIRIGEESGTLFENLNYLAVKLKKDNELKAKVKGAMIYPILVFCLALALGLGITIFVFPKVLPVFQSVTFDLPWPTKALMGITDFLSHNYKTLFLGILATVILTSLLKRIPAVRFLSDRVNLMIPGFGRINTNFNLAFFSRTFYLLLKSGVPLSEGLKIISQTMPNRVYQKECLKIKAKAEAGSKISAALKDSPRLFPGIFSDMVLTGEKSGSLEESLLYLADYYEKEVDNSVKDLSSILEPMLLIFIGLFVGFTAIAVILPMYKLIGSFQFG